MTLSKATDSINILASSDDNYAQHVGVMFLSLLSNTKEPNRVHLFLIDNNISKNNKRKIDQLAKSFGSSVSFLESDEKTFKDLPSFRYGLAAYQRLSLGEFLPKDIQKVIYLDADIVVVDDIVELWNESLAEQPLAAVENLSPKACASLGFDRQKYFNSGVLLVDVAAWRENQIKEKTINFISQNSDEIRFVDQCALNSVFENNWKKLSLKWNLQADAHGVLKKYAEGCGYSQKELNSAIKKPSIIHFIGTQKPWLWDCHNAYQPFFSLYREKSPWKGQPFSDANVLSKLKHFLAIKKLLRQFLRYRKLTVKAKDLQAEFDRNYL